MAFFVYIIQSQKDGTFYKGSSSDPKARLEQHNLGLSRYTARKTPWTLVYVEQLPSKRDMLIRERKLKRGNPEYFLSLINAESNLVHRFI